MDKSLSNEYYIYLHPDQEPIPWNPSDAHPFEGADFTYFGKVFEAMEKTFKDGGLVFYFTWDRVQELPSYGQNVVAVVVGDEWCRIPMYFHKVRAVFKCYGTRPILGCNPLLKPSYLNFLTLIQFLKTWVNRLPGLLNYWFQKFKSWRSDTAKITPIYDIPVGYSRQLELPIKDMEERLYDVFFAGSLVHTRSSVWSLKYWFGNPKSISRKKMISTLNTIKGKYPEIKVELSITPDFRASENAGAKIYSEKMMDAKICLVPRGTSFETFRFFEGLRYGCIVVTEALPSREFYDGSPAIQLTDWSELEGILEKLFENKNLRQEKHQESLNWWKTKCSEAAVGAYMAEKLNSLRSCSN
jgi:hypothetical protein